MAPGGRPGLLGLSSRFSCWLKSDLGMWSIVSPCARTAPIQLARIFELDVVPGFYLMRNYVLDIPNWQNVPRWSQSSAFSLGALWLSCIYYYQCYFFTVYTVKFYGMDFELTSRTVKNWSYFGRYHDNFLKLTSKPTENGFFFVVMSE